MENILQVFNNASFGDLRVIVKNNEYWFAGKDVANALGYTDTDKAIRVHVDEEDKQLFKPDKTAGLKSPFDYFPFLKSQASENTTFEIPNRGMMFISESGLYSLILSSKLPKAKEFKRWVTSEILPSIRKTGSYSVKQEKADELKEKRVDIMLKNAKAREAKLWLELANRTDIKEYKQIAESYAGNVLAEKEVFALPQVEKKTYSATEIAKILNVSAKKIGALANKYNLKTEQFGKWFYDKSRYSNKEVETFRYYENAISQFRFLLGGVMA